MTDWSASSFSAPGIQDRAHSIDVAGTFAPEPLIERPGSLDDGVEVTVSLACEFPWDQDSDSSDNLQRIILAGEANSDSRSEDFRTGAISGVIVIIIGGMFILNSRSRGATKKTWRRWLGKSSVTGRSDVKKQWRKAGQSQRLPLLSKNRCQFRKNSSHLSLRPRLKQENNNDRDDLDDFERRLRRLGNS